MTMSKKKIFWAVVYITLVLICGIMLHAFGYEAGRERGRDEIVDAVNEYLNQYNTYLVERETASDGRNYQLGSGKGFIKLSRIFNNKYLLYEYEDGNLVFSYDNIKP